MLPMQPSSARLYTGHFSHIIQGGGSSRTNVLAVNFAVEVRVCVLARGKGSEQFCTGTNAFDGSMNKEHRHVPEAMMVVSIIIIILILVVNCINATRRLGHDRRTAPTVPVPGCAPAFRNCCGHGASRGREDTSTHE